MSQAAADAHVNGDCWPDNCIACQNERADCEVCDGTGEVDVVRSGLVVQTMRCVECLGTGVEQ